MSITKALVVLLAPVVVARGAWTQCQIQKLVASDAQQYDGFGTAVTIDGDWAAVGEPSDSELFAGSGAVFIFHRSGSTWIEVQKLKSADAAFGDNFGEHVAMSGTVLVVSSAWSDPGGVSAAGAVYVFELVGSMWTQTAKLVASDAESGDFFGESVDTTGDRILVGAAEESQLGLSAGAAYVFDRVGPTWVQTKKLTASDGNFTDTFGLSVSLDGDRALVGAPNKEGPAGSEQGAAYLFEDVLGVWTEVQKLQASDGGAGEAFGSRTVLAGTTAVIGATAHTHAINQQGAAYVFTDTGSGWIESQELTASDASSPQNFGCGLGLSGIHLIVGAASDIGSFDTYGSAYLYRLIGSTWTRVGKFLPTDGADGDVFGLSVDISGDTAIGGAFGVDDACPDDPGCNSGAAYLFQIAPTGTQYGSCSAGAPCGNGDKHGGCDNSTGQGAILCACGSGSVASDDLRIGATHFPPSKLTLLIMAPLQTAVAFGDGIRVVKQGGGVALYRLGGVVADAQGVVMRGPGIVAQTQNLPPPGHIQAGQTWNFQLWYRDSVSQGPCHTGTNFTNGAQVAFGP